MHQQFSKSKMKRLSLLVITLTSRLARNCLPNAIFFLLFGMARPDEVRGVRQKSLARRGALACLTCGYTLLAIVSRKLAVATLNLATHPGKESTRIGLLTLKLRSCT